MQKIIYKTQNAGDHLLSMVILMAVFGLFLMAALSKESIDYGIPEELREECSMSVYDC